MSWMSSNMQMETGSGGGIGKMFGRAVAGESLFVNTYTARSGNGEIAFASTVPGQILAMDVSMRPIVAQKTAFLAKERNVEMSIFFQKKIGAGFFGGEGFIMEKFSGKGLAFLEIGGSVVEYELGAGETMLFDTGYLAAMDITCSLDIKMNKGLGNMLFGGEGLFNTQVTGPGHVWVQTMPTIKLAGALQPFLVSSSN
jgi:uncharacterized protein (TIGR00266 family)